MSHATKITYSGGTFESLYDQTPAMMHSVDIDGNIVHVNAFWLNKLGYKKSEVLHKNFINFLIDSEKEYARKVTIPNYYKNGASENVPYKMKCKDGKVLEVLLSSTSIRDSKGKFVISNAVLTDVTQSNALKNELEKTQKLLSETHAMAKVGVWEVNLLTNEIYWSDVTRMIMEVSEDYEAKGDAVAAFYKEGESRERFTSAVGKAMSQGVSYDFESEVITSKGNEIWARSIGNIEFRNDVPYRMYGSFQDITDRKKMQLEVVKSEEKYKSLFNSFSDIYYRTDENNNVIAISPSVEKHYGYKVEELIGKKSDTLVVDRSQVDDLRKLLIKYGKIDDWITEVTHKNGGILTVSVNIVANYNQKRVYKGLTGVIRNITEKIKAAKKEKSLAHKYEQLFHNSNDAIIISDVDTNDIIETNESAQKLLGYNKEQFSSLNLIKLSETGSLEQVEKWAKNKNEIKILLYQTQIKDKHNTLIDVEISAKKILIEGKIIIQSFIRNISERLLLEKKEKTLSYKYEQLFHTSSDAIFLFDPITKRIVETNLAAQVMLGYSAEELNKLTVLNLRGVKSSKITDTRIEKILASKLSLFESIFVKKSGDIIPIEISTKAIVIDGKQLIQSFARDISDRYLAEETLKTSEKNLKRAEHLTKMGNWEYNSLNKIYCFSDEIANIFEVKEPEKVSFELIKSRVHPDDILSFNHHVRKQVKAKEKKHTTFSYRVIIDNKVKYLDSINESYFNEGITTKMFGTIQDVTESRMLEIQLYKKNNQLNILSKIERAIIQAKNIINLSNQVSDILIKDLDFALVQIKLPSNDGTNKLISLAQKTNSKYTDENLDWLNNPKIKKPQHLNSTKTKLIVINNISSISKPKIWKEKLIESKIKSYVSIPFSFREHSKGVVDFYIDTPLQDGEGDIEFLNQVVNDLAVGLNALEINREKEELTGYNKMLVESLNLVSFEVDVLNNLITFRGSTQTVLGYSKEELGNSFTAFNDKIHPFDLEQIKNRAKYQKGNQVEFEYRFEQKNGTYTWVNTIDRVIKNKNNELITVNGIILNIDAKRNEIKNQLAAEVKGKDLERKRIAEELHDSLGQTLSVASMSLNAIRNDVRFSNPLNQGVFTNVQSLVDQAITETREISHNLIPSALTDFGLIPSLEADIIKINTISDIQFYFYHQNVPSKLNEILEVNVYKIIKEGINNIIKHSKAKVANIQVISHEELLVLMIEDDGIGFDEAATLGNSGIGLQNLRNRVKSMGGEIFIETNKGVLITIEIQM